VTQATGTTRGNLRVYLGAAPGVGKTYALLSEAHRRHDRGTDVVVGYVETHGRKYTAELIEGLEVVPRRTLTYRGSSFEEMDVDAILRRHPKVAVVDELAHTNVVGSRNEKRWQDVQELLDAGIDVLTAVNIQHLESVNDVVEKITGIKQLETVPDAVVRAADQVELRDMTAEALRRRLAHGNVYAPEKVDAALSNYFRVGNLNALRELALLWTADRVEDALDHYRAQHAITGTWETRERVVVALTGGREGENLIRRAARIAARSGSAELLAVHVVRADGLATREGELVTQRQLVESLGGSYHQVMGDNVPAALLAFARAENATQLVLGESLRRGPSLLLSSFGITRETIRNSGDIDVHIVTHESTSEGRGRAPRSPLGQMTRRRIAGFVLALVLPALLTVGLIPFRSDVNLVSDMLLFLLVTVICSMVGGFAVAVVAAVVSSLLVNYYFTPPLYTFNIQESNNVFAVFVFIAVGLQVSWAMSVVTRRTRDAARAAAEARTLADLASAALGGDDRVGDMLARVRETFGLASAALYARSTKSGDWTPIAVAADFGQAPLRLDTADVKVPVGPDLKLGLQGRILGADDQRLIAAFAAQVAVAYDHQRLRDEAASAAPLAEANKTRTALLAAVGHDLRTPLAAAKASVSGLRSRDIRLEPADRDELLKAADESLDKLSALVDNLLDMSRLQAGATPVVLVPTSVDEVAARALDGIGPQARKVLIDIPDGLPTAAADGGLLERVLANLVANALRHSPPGQPPSLTASFAADRVEIRVIDRGTGIPPQDLERVFLPFQRLGDTDNSTGVGLGLALSRGLTEAMGGTLDPEETPGGGLTMVVSLRSATESVIAERGDLT
jgi:two-component system sensor histidine kinase KdpD